MKQKIFLSSTGKMKIRQVLELYCNVFNVTFTWDGPYLTKLYEEPIFIQSQDECNTALTFST